MSRRTRARMPKRQPEAPVEAMAGAAKLPPRTNPKMPLLR